MCGGGAEGELLILDTYALDKYMNCWEDPVLVLPTVHPSMLADSSASPSAVDTPTPRAGHAVVSVWWMGEEALFAFGGFDGEEVMDETCVFLPSVGKWEGVAGASGSAPAPRAMHAMAVLDHARGRIAGHPGIIIVFGGWAPEMLRADTCTYDLATHEWESPSERVAIGAAPTARHGHTLVSGGDGSGELLLFGGDTGDDVSAELWCVQWDAAGGHLTWKPLLECTGMAPAARSGHSACVLPGGSAAAPTLRTSMCIFGGRSRDGTCLDDVHVLTLGSRRWSSPRLGGDVPRPRWAAACCVLPSGGPHGIRLIIDGGRDDHGWVGEQTLIDVVVGDAHRACHEAASAATPPPGAPGTAGAAGAAAVLDGVMVLHCHTVLPAARPDGADGTLDAADADGGGGDDDDDDEGDGSLPALSGHAAAVAAGTAWLVGGSRADGPLTWRTRPIAPEVVRFYRPEAGTLGFKSVSPPTLFDELIGPDLLASTHTSTRVGGKLFVLGGHDAPRGLLGQNGGGLILSVLDLRTLSWSGRYETLQEYAPKLRNGHTAVALPSVKGIAVFGGVRSTVKPGAGAASRMSNELHVLRLAVRAPTRGRRASRADPATPLGSVGELGGEPSRWVRCGGAFFHTIAGWPTPVCGHSATALPAPYAWAVGRSHQGAMLVVGGYTTDAFVPDGAEGELSGAAYLLRPLDARWLALYPDGTPPTPRTLHAAALLSDVTGASDDPIGGGGNSGGGSGGGRLLRVCIVGGWGLPRRLEATRASRIASATHLDDAWVPTLDPSVEGRC